MGTDLVQWLYTYVGYKPEIVAQYESDALLLTVYEIVSAHFHHGVFVLILINKTTPMQSYVREYRFSEKGSGYGEYNRVKDDTTRLAGTLGLKEIQLEEPAQ